MNLLDLARSALPVDCSPEGATKTTATPQQARELRELVGMIGADWSDADRAEALAVALADPDAALTCFQALVAEREDVHARAPTDDGMRPCVACANLSGKAQCMAASRGEPLGWGMTAARAYFPIMTDRPQRCAGFLPLVSDPDQRSGAERWAWMLDEGNGSFPAKSDRGGRKHRRV